MTRSLVLTALALVAGAAGYAATAHGADGAASGPRTITLRSQDVAVFGSVQCIAAAEAGARHFLCSRRPRSRSRYDTAVYASSVVVFRMGQPDDPLFTTR